MLRVLERWRNAPSSHLNLCSASDALDLYKRATLRLGHKIFANLYTQGLLIPRIHEDLSILQWNKQTILFKTQQET